MTHHETPSMTGKIVAITGGTGGIGHAAAQQLAELGATLILIGRNRERGEDAAASLSAKPPGAKHRFLQADLSTVQSAVDLSNQLQNSLDTLDVLINNAGALEPQHHQTRDGIDYMMAVNYISPFALTESLFPLLKATEGARVVNVTSGAYRRAEFQPSWVSHPPDQPTIYTYAAAKLALTTLTAEWAQRQDPDVLVVAADPGAATTQMTRSMKPSMMPWHMRPMFPIMRLAFQTATPDKAAKALTVAARADIPTGTLVNRKGKVHHIHADAQTSKLRETVWKAAHDHITSLIPD